MADIPLKTECGQWEVRGVCPHTETRANGIGYTSCAKCGARFAVVPDNV